MDVGQLNCCPSIYLLVCTRFHLLLPLFLTMILQLSRKLRLHSIATAFPAELRKVSYQTPSTAFPQRLLASPLSSFFFFYVWVGVLPAYVMCVPDAHEAQRGIRFFITEVTVMSHLVSPGNWIPVVRLSCTRLSTVSVKETCCHIWALSFLPFVLSDDVVLLYSFIWFIDTSFEHKKLSIHFLSLPSILSTSETITITYSH